MADKPADPSATSKDPGNDDLGEMRFGGGDLAATLQRLKDRAVKPGEAPKVPNEQERLAAEISTQLLKDLGARYAPADVSLKKFEIYHPNQRVVVESLTALVAELPALVREGRGLVFLGSVGTGKDHLMAAMLYSAARHGIRCRWFNGQEFFGGFRDRIDTGQRDEETFRQWLAPQVLGISDPVPPIGEIGAWNTTNLYRLIDRRYRERRSTWLSVNASSMDEAEATLSSPNFDRLRQDAELFRCFWPSYRERKRGARAG